MLSGDPKGNMDIGLQSCSESSGTMDSGLGRGGLDKWVPAGKSIRTVDQALVSFLLRVSFDSSQENVDRAQNVGSIQWQETIFCTL